MIRNDTELQVTQERILRFERFLAGARKRESAANYEAMSKGYLMEIDKMNAEIREYLSRLAETVEAT